MSVSITRLSDNVTSNSLSYTYNNLPAPDITSITPSVIPPNTSETFDITGSNFLDYGFLSLENISAGAFHTCGIDENGVGYCWGWNLLGQLGDGSNDGSKVATLINQGERPGGVTFSSIEVGGHVSCGVGSDGNGYCWGFNGNGQLGNGNTGTNSNVPVLVSSGAMTEGVHFKSISTSGFHSCGLGSDGNGYCWGKNDYGQLGNGNTGTNSNVPVLVSQGARPYGVTFVDISVGQNHTCGFGNDGKGYCWGYNNYGQLGNGTTGGSSNEPVLVSQGAMGSSVTFKSLNVGSHHACGIGNNYEGYCWGWNNNGQLGNNNKTSSNVPVLVSLGERKSGSILTDIFVDIQNSCGLDADGNAYCWGLNNYGQVGNGRTGGDITTPALVSQGVGTSFVSMAVGAVHACAVDNVGKGYCWGYNGDGQLGNNEVVNRITPSYVLRAGLKPTIEFGTTSATSTTYTSTTEMSAVSPVLGSGIVAVKLTNPDGQYDTYEILAGNIPSAPLNLVATYGDTEVSLGWLKPSDDGGGITDYIIQYSNDSGNTWATFDDGTSTNTFATVTGLTNGNLYTFRVAAINPVGTGPYSNTAQSTPQALAITSISPTSGLYLGGGSMAIEATGLGDTKKFVQVSSGAFHSCALDYDGNGYCWGNNGSGQLGNGNSGNSNVPVLVSQGARPEGVIFNSISVGSGYSCGIGSDGQAYCWGENSSGQLGNGNSSGSNVPVLVSQGDRSSGVTFISISPGSSHSCGIGSDGQAYCWGYNGNGQLGNGNTGTNSNVPKLVSQGERPSADITFISISVGSSHSCGIGSNGEGYCWGENDYGQLGNGNTGAESNIPVLVSQGARSEGVTFISISVGGMHTCGIGSNGEGYCWGYNGIGQLGNGNTGTESNVPVLVSQGARTLGVTFDSVSTGNNHTCGTGSDGNGYCWGYNGNGQLGNGSLDSSNVPVLVSQGERPIGVTLTSISGGQHHTCGIGSDGEGYCWGDGYYGQLGTGENVGSSTPLALLGSSSLYNIHFGDITYYGIKVSSGQTSLTVSPIPAYTIGTASISITRVDDSVTSNSVPYSYLNLPTPDITNINPSVITTAGGENLALTGSNFLDYGPIELNSVSVGNTHTCGLDSVGNAYCWGDNASGQLGTGDLIEYTTPKLVLQGDRPEGVKFVSINAGNAFTCGIGDDNNGYCWGKNGNGQLGTGDAIGYSSPKLVLQGDRSDDVTFTSISVGDSHTCAIGSDGNGYCWGSNNRGQLGINSNIQQTTPKLVAQGDRTAGVTFTQIVAAKNVTCSIGSNNWAYCWGNNYYGAVGNNSGSHAYTPKMVDYGAIPLDATIRTIDATGSHVCVLASNDKAYCWGSNYSGQVGNGAIQSAVRIPAAVVQGEVPTGEVITQVVAGSAFSCAIGSDNKIYCWGDGGTGKIGTGYFSTVLSPVLASSVAIPSPEVPTSIKTSGGNHACILSSSKKVYCWGSNSNGQLGNGSTENRRTLSYVILEDQQPTIRFGTVLAASTTYTSTTAMSAVSPEGLSIGTLAVKLTNPDGQYDTYDITVQSVPSVPGNLSATVGNTQVTLTWSVPSSDGGSAITDYIIQYRRYDEENWTTFDDGMSTNTTATVTGLTNDKLYYFKVAAVNSIGVSPYTDPVTATPVNQLPSFTNMQTVPSSTVNPGATLTWKATASDSDGQVRLRVCKTQELVDGVCVSGEWCNSGAFVDSDPSCSSTPYPITPGLKSAFVYIIDNDGAQATGTYQGREYTFTVNSVAPSITHVTLNGGEPINLAEKDALDYTEVILTATIISPNTCSTISSVKGYLYRSGKGYVACNQSEDANDNYCYPEVTCTLNSDSCVDPNDGSADYTCVAHVKYHADPTDTGTQYDLENWLTTIKATNDGDLSDTIEIDDGVEMNSLTAFDLTPTLYYGTLRIGESNNPGTDNPMQVLTTTATGNVGLDQLHKGEGIGMCIDFPVCTVGAPLSLSYQRYTLSASTSYSSGVPLTGAPVSVSLNVPKVTSIPTSRSTWWGLLIPTDNPVYTGTYYGQNTITAEKSPVANW